jgi:hypothetical protein
VRGRPGDEGGGAGVDRTLEREAKHGGQGASGGEEWTSTSAREGLHK